MYNKEKIFDTFKEIVEGSKPIQPYVIIAQPRRDLKEIPAQKFDAAMGTHIDLSGYSHAFIDIGGEMVDVARNYLIEKTLAETKAKYLLFIGEDTVFPWDGFRLLHETAEKNPDAMVSGVYYIKLSAQMVYVFENESIRPANVDPGQIIEAWQTGMDALLIPTKLLREMKEKDPDLPFCCIAAPNTYEGIPFIGEDNFFVHRWHKAGYRLLVNTDVQCLHCDLKSGRYTAHPSIQINKYFTNMPMTGPMTWDDKKDIDTRWTSRLPSNLQNRDIISAVAYKYCKGQGLAIGETGINKIILDDCISIDDIKNYPLKDNSQDYIVSHNTIKDTTDIIGDFLAWDKKLTEDGIIFLIFSERFTYPLDIPKKLTTIEEIEENHINPKKLKEDRVFTMDSLLALVEYCNAQYKLNWVALEKMKKNETVEETALVLRKI